MVDEDRSFTPRGRFSRFVKLGGLAAQVATNAVARRVGASFASDDEKARVVRESLVKNADRIVQTMGEMKGAAMKLGQMLSVAPEALPREFLEKLKSLQRESPAMPYEMVASQIEASLGMRPSEAFRYFDPVPLGAASIGQVHRARLFDGRDVAVKVQYPGIAENLQSDLQNLASLIGMGRVVADGAMLDRIIDEISRGILEEADYRHEAENLVDFGAILEKHEKIVVPKLVGELSGDAVLTMELLVGEKLDLAIDRVSEAEKNAIGEAFSETYVWMFHAEQVLHADPHPGNFLLLPDGRFGFLDFGCMRRYAPEFTDGWIDILVAKWEKRPERLPEIFERLGFAGMGGRGPDTVALLETFTDALLEPFLADRDFDWGSWHPERNYALFYKAKMDIVRHGAPAEAVFYFRVAAGVWGFLQRSKIRGNWFRMGQRMAERRGRLGRG